MKKNHWITYHGQHLAQMIARILLMGYFPASRTYIIPSQRYNIRLCFRHGNHGGRIRCLKCALEKRLATSEIFAIIIMHLSWKVWLYAATPEGDQDDIFILVGTETQLIGRHIPFYFASGCEKTIVATEPTVPLR